jgi:uncharacterized protein YceK
MILRLLACIGICLLAGCPSVRRAVSPPQDYAPRAGDFVFLSLAHDPLMDTIEGSTGSPF